jgi:NNP family nitrate/nitrite transporter-like MFS transporter
VAICAMLFIPKMEISSPGQGIMARQEGMVNFVSENMIKVGENEYPVKVKNKEKEITDSKIAVFPTKDVWQEPVVKVGDEVIRKQLIGKGVTKIYFQANVWIFAVLVILIGSIWGIGKAAVYKHIPDYFPNEVGVVGGMVGVLGGLGGFFCPIIFGYLLKGTGLWTSCWLFMLFLSALCLFWMHNTIVKLNRRNSPETAFNIEVKND